MSRRRVLAFCLALSASALLALPALASARIAYVAGAGFYAEGLAAPVELDTGVFGSTSSVATEGPPSDVAITPDGRTAFVSSFLGVLPIDVATNTAATEIDQGPQPCPGQLATKPDGTLLYALDVCARTVSVIDVATRTEVLEIPVTGASSVNGIAVTRDGGRAYVTDGSGNAVVPIDLTTNTVGTPFEVGQSPQGIAVTPDGTSAYVVLFGDGAIKRIDLATNAVGPAIGVAPEPQEVTITPDSSRAYVQSFGSKVTPVDLATGTAGAQVTAGDFLQDVAITPNGARTWVTEEEPGELIPIEVPGDALGTALPAPYRLGSLAIVPNQGPRAAFTATPNPTLRGEAMRFDATGSSDSDGSLVRYDWDFGDGTILRDGGPTPTHTYSFGGPHTVTLTVVDNEGCSLEIVFPGQTAFCNGGPQARTAQQVQVTPKCITVNGQASSFVPKYRPAKVVPGVRVRLSASAPAKLTVDSTLTWSKRGGGKVALPELVVNVQQWRRVRYVIPAAVREKLPLGSKVKLQLRIAAQPLDESLCAATPVEKTLKLRVVKVIPGAVQAGRPK